MAKLSSYQRLIKEDVEEDFQPLIEKVGFSLNQFADQVLAAFKKNITVDDNLNLEYRTLEFTTDAAGAMPVTQFQSSLTNRLKGLIIIKFENLTDISVAGLPSTAPYSFYSQDGKLITITKIVPTLAVSTKYRITFLGLGS